MSATTPEDRTRLQLEDAIALLLEADERLRCLALRITHRMRTDDEAAEAREINRTRRLVQRAHRSLLTLHPDRRR